MPAAIVLALRTAPFVLVLAAISAPHSLDAQSSEGTLRLLPPLSTIDLADGPFTVFVAVDGLQHHGTVEYDDNRDTVPDREIDSRGLAAFEFAIAYDHALLEVVAVTPALAGLQRTGRQFQCLGPRQDVGLVSYGCISTGPEPPGAQGTLTLASVVFRPVATGASPLMLDADIAGPLGTDASALQVVGGVARIQGGLPADRAGTEVGSPGPPANGGSGVTGATTQDRAVTPALAQATDAALAEGGSGRGPEEAGDGGLLGDEATASGGQAPQPAPDGAGATSAQGGGLDAAFVWMFVIGGIVVALGLGGALVWVRRQ